MPFKVLISRKESADTTLGLGAEINGFQLLGVPFIETKEKFFKLAPQRPDWILFTSKNGVKYFLEGAKEFDWEGVRIAAVGSGTANALLDWGLEAKLVPNYSDTDRFLEEFKALLEPAETVWYPSAVQTIGKVEKALKDSCKLHPFAVYQTMDKPKLLLEEFDLYFFTSPSNVRSFFKLNTIHTHAQVLAIGSSTLRELAKHGVQANIASGYTAQDILKDIKVAMS